MKSLASFLLFVFIASGAGAATVSGFVGEEGSTNALSGMVVQAWNPSGVLVSSAATDTAGNFSLVVAAGNYHLLAYDPSGVYATSFYNNAESFETSTIVAVSSNGLSGVRFTLVRAGYVEGVVAATDKTPLNAATVTAYNLSGTRRAFTMTDATGRYRITVPSGTYKIAAWDDSGAFLAQFYSQQGTFAAAAPVNVVAEMSAAVDFRLDKAALLAGTVTAGGGPFAASVSVYDSGGAFVATVRAAADGVYAVHVPAGSYRLVMFDPDGNFAPEFWSGAEAFDASTVVSIGEGESRTGLDANLVRAGRFTGVVRDVSNGALLAGTTVAAFNGDGTIRAFAVTGAAGAHTLVVPPGLYRAGAWDSSLNYLRRFYPAEVLFGSAPEWNVSAAQTMTLDFALPRGAVVTGIVRDAATIATLPDMTVGAYDAGGVEATSNTDSSGAFRLLLESGTWELAAHDNQFRYATGKRTISVVAGSTTEGQDFVLSVGAHLAGRITTSAGKPIAGAVVGEYDSSGAMISEATTRDDGSYDLASPAGTFAFAAFDPSQQFRPSVPTNGLAVSAGQVISGFNFTLEPSLRRRPIVR